MSSFLRSPFSIAVTIWLLTFLAGAQEAAAPAPAAANNPGGAQAAAKPDEGEGVSWLGVQMEPTAAMDLDEDEKPPPGVGILSVMKESPAAKGGIKSGDRVLKIGATALKNEQDLRTQVRALKPGTEVTVTIERDGKEEEVKVVLEKMPAQAGLQLLPQLEPFETEGRPKQVRFMNSPLRVTSKDGEDTVQLVDGNRLEGTVIALNDGEVSMKVAETEVALELSGVEKIRLGGMGRSEPVHNAVMLRNGGQVMADSLTLGDGKFSLMLPEGGEWKVPRDQVNSAAMLGLETAVFAQSPRAGDGWIASPTTAWKVEDESWKIMAGANRGWCILGRKFPMLPDAFEFSFELTAKDLGNLQVTLCGMKAGVDDSYNAPGGMRVQFGEAGRSVSLFQYDGAHFFNNVPLAGGVMPKELPPALKDTRRFAFYCRRTTGTLIVCVNGVVLGKFDTAKVAVADLPRAGRALRVMSIHPQAAYSKITLRPWVGELPMLPPVEGADFLVSEDNVLRSGALEKITAEAIQIGAENSPRQMPSVLKLAEAKAPPAKSVAWVELKSGSAFAVSALRAVEGRTLVMQTHFAGEVSLPLASLRRLDFVRPGDEVAKSKLASLDRLTFSDGRRLFGKLIPPVKDGKISWKLSAAKNPLQFAAGAGCSVLLGNRAEVRPMEGPQVVKLRNGDWLPGQIVATDREALTFKTAFSEALRLRLTEVMSIYGSSRTSARLADAASGRSLWPSSISSGRVWINGVSVSEDDDGGDSPWQYADGVYSIPASSAQKVGNYGVGLPLPKMDGPTSLEFTVDGNPGWFTASLEGADGWTAFSVYSSGGMFQVMHNRQGSINANGRFVQPEQFRYTLPVEERNAVGPVRYQFIFVPALREIHFAIKGRKIGTMRLKPEDSWPELRAMNFTGTYGAWSGFSISKVWISPWDGRFGKGAPPPPGHVSLVLANGDETTGLLGKLGVDALEIECEAGLIPIPLSRVTVLELNQPPNPATPTCRLRLFDRGQLSASAIVVEGDQVKATTVHGELAIPLATIKEIVFSPQKNSLN